MYYPQVYGDPKFMYKQNSRAEYKIYNRAVVIVNRGKNARNKKAMWKVLYTIEAALRRMMWMTLRGGKQD